jgi:hypothetical protein
VLAPHAARSTPVPFLLAALAIGCGAREPSPPGAGGAAATHEPPAAAAAAGELTARETFRLEVPGLSVIARRIAAVDGGALIAWEIGEPVELPGHGAVRPKGEQDAVVTRVAVDGAIEAVHAIGGGGEIDLVELVDGDPAGLILRGDAPLTIAGTRLDLPAKRDELLYPRWAALVSLDRTGAPSAALALDGTAQTFRALRLAGDWIVATSHDGEETDRAVVTRHRGGKVVWTRELAGVQVGQLVMIDGAIGALTRSRVLGITRLDPDSGAVLDAGELERPGFGGDLGALVGAVATGAGTIVYGHSGRETVQVDGRTRSHSIEPLAIAFAAGKRPRRDQLLDVTGNVEAVGTVGGAPAALVSVIHNGALYGGRDVPHRGAYLVVGVGPAATLIPLVQYRYPDDDWENQPAEMVFGTARTVSVDGLIAGDRVWRVGLCEKPRRGCVEQHQLVASEAGAGAGGPGSRVELLGP